MHLVTSSFLFLRLFVWTVLQSLHLKSRQAWGFHQASDHRLPSAGGFVIQQNPCAAFNNYRIPLGTARRSATATVGNSFLLQVGFRRLEGAWPSTRTLMDAWTKILSPGVGGCNVWEVSKVIRSKLIASGNRPWSGFGVSSFLLKTCPEWKHNRGNYIHEKQCQVPAYQNHYPIWQMHVGSPRNYRYICV